MNTFLTNWGWSGPTPTENFFGRIISEHRDRYVVITAEGEKSCRISGKLLFETNKRTELPATGDWVELNEGGIIQKVLNRKNLISRIGPNGEDQIIASNMDTALILTSANHDFNLARIERILSLLMPSGVNVVVVITKADLCENPWQYLAKVEKIHPYALAISCLDQSGIEDLKKLIQPGKSYALLGMSGVGKSTLVNNLLGVDSQTIRDISNTNDRGRHTTTNRELFLLPNGGIMLDMPGMRSFGLTADSILSGFDDIVTLSSNCKFHNCAHESEPYCKVKEALESGEISRSHWNNYQKMRREIAFQERKNNPALLALEKKKWKKRSKEIKG